MARRPCSPLRRGFLPIACCVPLLIAATPATRPADANTTEVVAVPAKVRFRVPAFWQSLKVKNLPADQAFLFDPTPASTKPRRPMQQQLVEVLLRPATTEETSLRAIADRARTRLLQGNPNIKFTKDAAITYAGRSVWTLQWTERITLKTPPAADGSQRNVGFMNFDRVDYEWLEHGVACHVGLHADVRFMPSLNTKVEPVVRGFVFDD